jgi:Zn-dependent protease
MVVESKEWYEKMEEKAIIIVLFFLMFYFLFTFSYISHEFIHLIQANFNYTEVCFLGDKPNESGWIKSENLNQNDVKTLELGANLGTITLSLTLAFALSFVVGNFIKRCRNA